MGGYATALVLFLALHVVGNAAFLLLVRVGRGGRFDYPLVGLTNYATAAVLALLGLGTAGLARLDPAAALLGLVNGAQYQTTYMLMYMLYGLVGVAVTTSILRLSVVVPVLASIGIWREWPNSPQAVGLVLAGAALPLLSGGGQRIARGPGEAAGARAADRPRRALALTRVALVVGTMGISGCGLLAAKAFAELGKPEQRPVYVATCYVVATSLSLILWPWRGRLQGARTSSTRDAWLRSVALGALVGAVNVGQIWVLLPALAQVPGVIAFPVAAAGGLALAALGARLLWKEQLGGRAGAGIGLALGAAALANVR